MPKLTFVANDERPLNGRLFLFYIFPLPTEDLFLVLQVPVDPRHMEVPSVSPILENVNWFEREVKDWFGMTLRKTLMSYTHGKGTTP